MIDPMDIERVGKLTTRVTPDEFNTMLERERYTLETLALEALRSQVRDQRPEQTRWDLSPIYPATGSITRRPTPTKRSRP